MISFSENEFHIKYRCDRTTNSLQSNSRQAKHWNLFVFSPKLKTQLSWTHILLEKNWKKTTIENFKRSLLVWLNGLLLFYKFLYRGLIMPWFSSIFSQKRFSFILIRFLSKNMSGTDLIKFKNSIFQIDSFENLTCNITWYSNFSLLHIGKLVWISMYLCKIVNFFYYLLQEIN